MFGQFFDRKLTRIAKIDRTRHVLAAFHHSDKTIDEIVDITETPRLLAISIERDVIPAQRLHNEVRHDAAIIRMHARAIRIEDPRNFDVELMLPVIVKEQRLRAAFAFIVTRPRPDRVHIAPIAFFLRMDGRVAIDLRRRGLKNARFDPLGQPQHIDRAMDARFCRLNWVRLVMNRARRTGQIVDLVDFNEERKRHIMA